MVTHDFRGSIAHHAVVWSDGSLTGFVWMELFGFMPGFLGLTTHGLGSGQGWSKVHVTMIDDLRRGGMSYVEILVLSELWAGGRLGLEKTAPKYRRRRRPISASAGSPEMEKWSSCQYLGAMLRSAGDFLRRGGWREGVFAVSCPVGT